MQLEVIWRSSYKTLGLVFLPELCELSQFILADFAEYFKNIQFIYLFFN